MVWSYEKIDLFALGNFKYDPAKGLFGSLAIIGPGTWPGRPNHEGAIMGEVFCRHGIAHFFRCHYDNLPLKSS